MIVVDTSAIMAIYLEEPDASRIGKRLQAETEVKISAGTVLELSIVLNSRKRNLQHVQVGWVDEFLQDGDIAIEAVELDQLQIARDAHARYGKGMGHPAQLNFGDCFAYALAKSLDVPLLFKGNDFSKTDIVSAL